MEYKVVRIWRLEAISEGDAIIRTKLTPENVLKVNGKQLKPKIPENKWR